MSHHNIMAMMMKQAPVSGGWDITDLTVDGDYTVTGTGASGIVFNPEGTEMYVTTSGDGYVRQYTLTTAFDVTSASLTNSFNLDPDITKPTGIDFNPDGTKMFITQHIVTYPNPIATYILSTPWDLSKASLSVSNAWFNSPQDIRWFPDGSGFFYTCGSLSQTQHWNTSTPWTIKYTQIDSMAISLSYHGMFLKPDGLTIFHVGTNGFILEHSLSTAFSFAGTEILENGIDLGIGSCESLWFNSDGTRMFVAELTTDKIHQYIVG